MTMMEHAKSLAKEGFYVFRLAPKSKLPIDSETMATRDPKEIERMWIDPVMEIEQPYNVGISTTRYADNKYLIAIDVDNKDDKHGDDEIKRLIHEGKIFPETYAQTTPTGGRHIVYSTDHPMSQGVNVLGRGLDTRGKGGYLVAAGSVTEKGEYKIAKHAPVAEAPSWLLEICDRAPTKATLSPSAPLEIDLARAKKLASDYLKDAPHAVQGDGGDQTTFAVAAKLKDLGVPKQDCVDLMLTHWNDRCEPPWSADAIVSKVEHAFRYGQNQPGSATVEAQFDAVDSEEELPKGPIDEINEQFAFVITGGGHHILWETTDVIGKYKVEHLSEHTFHRMLAHKTIQFGDKTKQQSTLWMQSPKRRSYDGICFDPGREAPPRFYNLWRGFAVEMAPPMSKHKSVDMFLEHLRLNICAGDEKLSTWLVGYFAHLVQKPWDKPLVAVVLQGGKGVGKNALIETVGHLLGNHYLLTANKRYIMGQFNGHLENCLMLTLDEAFWSGDKQAEGTLKDLITGTQHVIEQKGKEPYTVKNCTRVVIMGNEDWVVPASQDERRFAVFNVGDGRKKDRKFFQTMREGMEAGGYSVLLRYLHDYDIAKFEPNEAPSTKGLLDQKLSSLTPFHQWWFECLTDGVLVGADFNNKWETEITKERVRSAFQNYMRTRHMKTWAPEHRVIGKLFRQCLPQVDTTQKKKEGEDRINSYRVPSLDKCREEWDNFVGHPSEWP